MSNAIPPLGVGFAAFQDGTYELFVQNRETGEEWHHTGKWENEAELERLRQVFADCVICPAEPARSSQVEPAHD